MAKLSDDLRTILADVAQFLFVTLKTVDLPQAASVHRMSLISHLKNLQTEYPQLTWELQEDLYDVVPGSESTTAASTGIGSGQSNSTVRIAAVDITDATKRGYLVKKSVVKKFIPSNKKVWCIIKNGIFYEFEKQTSTSQLKSFPLLGLQVKELSRNEFELTGDNFKAIQYTAADATDLKQWVSVLMEESHVVADPRLSFIYESCSTLEEDEQINDKDLKTKRNEIANDRCMNTTNANKGIRDIGSAAEGTTSAKALKSKDRKPAAALPVSHDVSSARSAVRNQELCADIPNVCPTGNTSISGSSAASHSTDDSQGIYETVDTRPSKCPPAAVPRQKAGNGQPTEATGTAAQAGADESVTSTKAAATAVAAVAVAAARNDKSSNVTFRTGNSAPKKRQSQPGLPIPRKNLKKPNPDVGSANEMCSEPEIYVACWDCTAEAHNELTFRKGDRIIILTRQYEELGWWVGQLLVDGQNDSDDLVGLVPKDYVRKA